MYAKYVDIQVVLCVLLSFESVLIILPVYNPKLMNMFRCHKMNHVQIKINGLSALDYEERLRQLELPTLVYRRTR